MSDEDTRDRSVIADRAVQAAYMVMRKASKESGRAEPPDVGVSVIDLLTASFDEFMAAPTVKDVDWSGATIRHDEAMAKLTTKPIDVYLTAPEFDEGEGVRPSISSSITCSHTLTLRPVVSYLSTRTSAT